MEPQEYEEIMRALTGLLGGTLEIIAAQDPTLATLKQVLAQDRALQQMDGQGLRAFCADLEALYRVHTARTGEGGFSDGRRV